MREITPGKEYITIGSGGLLFSDAATGPWQDTINVKSFDSKIESEKKESKSSRDGLKKVVKTFNTGFKGSATCICNVPSKENLLFFMMAKELFDISQTAGTIGAGSEPECLAKLGKWVKIGTHRMLSNVVVKCTETTFSLGTITADVGNGGTAVLNTPTQGASIQVGTYTIEYDTDHYVLTDPDANEIQLYKAEGSDVYSSTELGFTVASGSPSNDDTWTCAVTGTPTEATMILNTDYWLDTKRGLIWVLSDNTKGVVDDDELKITYSYADHTAHRMFAGTKAQWKKHFWFIGDPVDGIQEELRGYANLIPSGDLKAIGEEEQEFTLELSYEDNESYHDSSGNGLYIYEDHGVRAD